MVSISDKIRGIIEAKNLNKTEFSKQIGMARDYVYNLSDETIKVSTLIRICDVLKIPIIDFFSENKAQTNNSVVQEPQLEYGNKDLEIKMLKARISNLEEINSVLKDQVQVYKQLEGKRKHKA